MPSNSTTATQEPSKAITSVEECKTFLINTVRQLREQQQISHSEQVSLYVTDVPIVHSTISEYEAEIKKDANLADVVQVNIKAGNPMPEALPQVDHTIGEEEVTVAIER